ncbi:MAG: hypothetical protein WD048_02930 [Chitinophagales bacterium]
MVKLTHIVNPYETKNPEALKIQELTLRSMSEAQKFTQNAEVKLYAAVHKNETYAELPDNFKQTLPIERSVLDIATFEKKIPFPLIEDILKLIWNIDCEYVIYTNMDIILQPYFYDFVSNELDKGYEALLINRRRVSLKHLKNSELPEILADPGKYHPGYDCFVIKKTYLQQFLLKDICVGIPFIGVCLAHNIFSFVKPYKIISHHHLTAHVGLQVMGGILKPYYKHNYAAFQKIRSQLKPHLKRENLPFSELPFYKRILSWGLNPSTPILLNMEIEGKGLFNKLYFFWNELRFKILERVSSSN